MEQEYKPKLISETILYYSNKYNFSYKIEVATLYSLHGHFCVSETQQTVLQWIHILEVCPHVNE